MPPIIIDRRRNPSKKSLSNRQRFIDRFRQKIRESVRKTIGKRSITDSSDQEVSIPIDTEEHRFNHSQNSGDWDYILPGNHDYIRGDEIKKPQSGSQGRGKTGSRDGDGEDDFSFYINYDEYLDIIFDDLALPDLIKKSEKTILSHQLRRAGYTTSGVPTNLNVEKTAIAGLSRRLALRTGKYARIKELEQQLEDEDDEQKQQDILAEIESLRIKAAAIGFLENVDMRYNNFVQQPKPITQAVMFCIMDVSFSMGENEKIIAKKFFMLLHLFLHRRYKNVSVVFIRHHDKAAECDENTFFTSRESGGTVVSTSYQLTEQIIKERFPADSWNIYVAQASDGDNASDDASDATIILTKLLPLIQFMCYIEICRPQAPLFHHETSLWNTLNTLRVSQLNKILMQQIHDEKDVIQIFRKFFAKK